MRLEGKEYVVREGDVMHFRFNVGQSLSRGQFRFL